MIVAERLQQALRDAKLSQSELARRVGVSQPTIYRAMHGKLYGTRSLHKIARELGTTPAYLTGEIDDPGEGAAPPIPEPAIQFVTLQVALPNERALARMFEGLLRAMPPGAGLDEQAELLARRLPVGLAQLRDLLPAAPAPVPTPREATPAIPEPAPR